MLLCWALIWWVCQSSVSTKVGGISREELKWQRVEAGNEVLPCSHLTFLLSVHSNLLQFIRMGLVKRVYKLHYLLLFKLTLMKSNMTLKRFFKTIEENTNEASTGKQQENGWASKSPSTSSSPLLYSRNCDDLIKSDKKLAKKYDNIK